MSYYEKNIYLPRQYRILDPFSSKSVTNVNRTSKLLCPITKKNLPASKTRNDILNYELEDVNGVIFNLETNSDSYMRPGYINIYTLYVTPGSCFINNMFLHLSTPTMLYLNDPDIYLDKDEDPFEDHEARNNDNPPQDGDFYFIVLRYNPDVDLDGAKFGLVRCNNKGLDYKNYVIIASFQLKISGSLDGGDLFIYFQSLSSNVFNPPWFLPTDQFRQVIHIPSIAEWVRTSPPAIEILRPTQGELLINSNSYDIEWDYSGFPSTQNVRIHLFRMGEKISTLVNSVPISDKKWTWTIDENTPRIDYGQIKITTLGYNSVSCKNIGLLSVNPTLSIDEPSGDEEWKCGETHNIDFSSEGLTARTVDIDLYYEDTYVQNIVSDLISYVSRKTWEIPNDFFASSNLIYNSSMNGDYSSNNGVAPGWSRRRTVGTTYSSVSDSSAFGETGLSQNCIVSYSTSGPAGIIQYIGENAIVDTSWYKIELALKIELGSVKLKFFDGTNYQIIDTFGVNSSWEEKTVYVQASKNFHSIIIETDSQTAANWYIDEIKVRKLYIGDKFKIKIKESSEENIDEYISDISNYFRIDPPE